MLEFYRLLSTLDADARNAVLTVIEGRDFGGNCLPCEGVILWERDRGFFACKIAAIRDVDRGDMEIEGSGSSASGWGGKGRRNGCILDRLKISIVAAQAPPRW